MEFDHFRRLEKVLDRYKRFREEPKIFYEEVTAFKEEDSRLMESGELKASTKRWSMVMIKPGRRVYVVIGEESHQVTMKKLYKFIDRREDFLITWVTKY
jgi:hypothetical protein